MSKSMKNNSQSECPSIYIARVFPNISPEKIKKVFEDLFKSKCVDRVDTVRMENKDGDKYMRVFVHFKFYPESAKSTKDKLLNDETVEVVYNHPWYWKCVRSKIDKPDFKKKNTRNGPGS